MANWTEVKHQLIKEFTFHDFKEALNFVNQVGELAEAMNHHPDIFLHDYKKVRLTLTTHSVGDVTDKDYKLSKKIDEII